MAGEIETKPNAAEAPDLWLAAEEWAGSEEFRARLDREFPDDADTWTDPVSRRHFISLMGASMALAGMAGCSPRPAPRRNHVPYTNKPSGMIPGEPLFFASSILLSGVATGVIVKSFDGRPIKVEGNPSHPGSKGGTDIFSQAAILELYDPDRATAVTFQGTPRTWEEAISALRIALSKLTDKEGGGIRILSETSTSPTLKYVIENFRKKYPKATWTQYEPLMRDNVREGAVRALGDAYATCYDFSQAQIVVSLDADFLTSGPGAIRYANDFMKKRKVRESHAEGNEADEMNRLYAVETMLTCTGAVADHRLSLKASEVENFARGLAAALKMPNVPPAVLTDKMKAWIEPLSNDLRENKEHKHSSIIVAGDHQPASLHALVHAMNDFLGNVGTTVRYVKPIESSVDAAPTEGKAYRQTAELKKLVDELNGGKIELLLILGGNPVYNAPADFEFAAAMDRARLRVHLGLHVNETSVRSTWHIPEAHALESWGDALGYDGTASVIQPLIAPLFGGRSAIELLAVLGAKGEESELSGLELVKNYWKRWLAESLGRKIDAKKDKDEQDEFDDTFDKFWETSVREGVIAGSAKKGAEAAPSLKPNWATKSEAVSAGVGMEINFRADPTIYDGRFANNGWLQELPKPISKLTWENAVIISPNTAKKIGVGVFPRWTAGEHGRMEVDIVEVNWKGRKVNAPAWVQPGHADDSVTIYLGYGREQAGRVGSKIGVNAYKLRGSEALWTGSGVELKKTGETTFLACTQAHHAMEGRKPVRRLNGNLLANLHSKDEEVAKKAAKDFREVMAPPAAANEADLINQNLPGPNERKKGEKEAHPPEHGHDHGHKHEHKHAHDKRLLPLTFYDDTNKDGRRWGMAIDLTSCTGCNVCMIACMAENNIPVVGKHEVTRGREMYWIRVDRYHEGNPDDSDNLKTYFQPVPCQQCEKAPCEVVCPVGATVHSTDGLNDMVYNRCVGTRYCSNNCPYKVRRFNFFTFADWTTESLKLGRNPDVTVRSRGVMEKCTYCVQRIRNTEIEAEREFRPIIDGEIKTACEAACPSGAIVFGDIADKDSKLNRWKSEPTNYGLLAELNTMPRTSYLAAVRNPNPKMPKGA